jgi:hypothetical protein
MKTARSALLIGTDVFEDTRLNRLPGAVADVSAVAEVLADPSISDFSVKMCRNANSYQISGAIEEFFADAGFDDFLILYITGHGLKDDSGRLYFAAMDTKSDRLASSAVSSAFVREQLIRSRSRRVFIILDCCFSGAFASSRLRRAGEHVDVLERLTAKGCVILTSSAALEYSFETSAPQEAAGELAESVPSLFTEAFVRGLRTGEADLNGDGLVEVSELYEYIYRAMREIEVGQTPMLSSELEGPFYVAYNPRGGTVPSPEPTEADGSQPTPVGQGGTTLTVKIDDAGSLGVNIGRRSFILATSGLLVQPRLRRMGAAAEWELDVRPLEADYHFPQFIRSQWPDTELTRSAGEQAGDWLLHFPPGNSFEGALAGVQVHRFGVPKDRFTTVSVPDSKRLKGFAASPSPGFAAVSVIGDDSVSYSILDKKAVRRQCHGDPQDDFTLAVPRAYVLDDLTYGVLWAAASLDESLTEDGTALGQTRRRLKPYDALKSSAVSRDAVSELNAISQMWLGSDFCARFIMSQLVDWNDVPMYWTREKSGEEASMWLLVRHKYEYLRKTGLRYATSPNPSMRAFCIPEGDVKKATRPQRILMFLAVALMEMLHIKIMVCIEPEYTAVEGFVLAPGRRGLIANWVRGEGIWHVEVVGRNARLSGFNDSVRYAAARSVMGAGTPPARLAELAYYLGIDWSWLRRRCREMGQTGWEGLVTPKSSLLGPEALNGVCTYVGALA